MEENVARPKGTVNCDQEAWVRARISTAIQMAIALAGSANCGADREILCSAIEGIINGAAIEVIQSLGLEPGYVNLRRRGMGE